MKKNLIGENYLDGLTKKWKKVSEGDNGRPLKRTIVSSGMNPIQKLARELKEVNEKKADKMFITLETHLKQDER